MSPRSSALFAAILAVCLATASAQFYKPGDKLPASVITETFDVAFPADVANVSLAQYDFTRNAGAKKYVTVVATFYSGCTPGREDYPTFTKYVSQLHSMTTNNFLPGNVAFVASLKNGVNAGVAEAWARINGSDVSVSGSNAGFPLLVDDRHRALVYKLFDAGMHPAYAVLDHCMRYAALLPAIATQNATNGLVQVVSDLLKNTTQACPDDTALPPAPELRPRRATVTFTPGPAPAAAPPSACVPAFGKAREVAKLSTGSSTAFAQPRTLAFHPASKNLWVGNNDTDSITILQGVFNSSTAGASASGLTHRFDRAPFHYMDQMAALAFGSNNMMATCQESVNTYAGMKAANNFMGPTLYSTVVKEGTPATGGWPKNIKGIYITAEGKNCDPDAGFESTGGNSSAAAANASAAPPTCFMTHADMLHASPLCMGMAHDPEAVTPYNNVFWVFDGLNSTLIRYDFEQPHGPASLDHSLANVRRYPEVKLTRVPGVPGHIIVDPETRTVFIVDTGAGRIVAVHADSGRYVDEARNDLGGNFTLWSSPAPSFEYTLFGCSQHKTFATGIDKPSGIALHGNTLLVGEHGTGKIIAFHKTTGARLGEFNTGAKKLFGLTVEPTTGVVWFVDGADASSVSYIKRTETCAAGSVPNGPAMTYPATPSSEGSREYCKAEALGVLSTHRNHTLHVGDNNATNNSMTPLGPGYGLTPSCMACDAGCDNDMLLMSGYYCHKCLPDNCRQGIFATSAGTCSNIIGKGYKCECDAGAFGDHCQHRVVTDNGAGAGGNVVTTPSTPMSTPSDTMTATSASSSAARPWVAAWAMSFAVIAVAAAVL